MQCVRELRFSVTGHQPHVRVLILFNDHTGDQEIKIPGILGLLILSFMSHTRSQFQCVCLSSCLRCILDNFLKPTSILQFSFKLCTCNFLFYLCIEF